MLLLHVGRFDLDVVAMRSRFEMPKQDAGGAADVDHLLLSPLPRRFGGPRLDVVRERVIRRLAQAAMFLPAPIYGIGVFRFGDEIRGQRDPGFKARGAASLLMIGRCSNAPRAPCPPSNFEQCYCLSSARETER